MLTTEYGMFSQTLYFIDTRCINVGWINRLMYPDRQSKTNFHIYTLLFLWRTQYRCMKCSTMVSDSQQVHTLYVRLMKEIIIYRKKLKK